MIEDGRVRALSVSFTLCALVLGVLPALAAGEGDAASAVPSDPASRAEAIGTDVFNIPGARCGTPARATREQLYGLFGGDPSDCSSNSTNPTGVYDPGATYEIRVVAHIVMNDSCSQGVISDALVHSQIEILNEDFLALTGSNGENGTDAQIRFALATEDPDGNPTTGITRSCNSTWFADSGSYWNTLAWDPHRYMNIYTNNTGALGYVPFLPADSNGTLVGAANDRVVVTWDAFGRNAPTGPPFDLGRTATHEVGHYLGLEHTFTPQGGCGSDNAPDCYGNGDLICDTNTEQWPSSRPCAVGDKSSCGSVDPSDNYMDYSDDICMMRFTLEQNRRMRCSMENYRPDVYEIVDSATIFLDGFESGDTTFWTP